ncbi:hypothetical protein [Tunturibacter empetritectus]|uniref:Uncharacterized protein n=1 Tax=Tunturiibacter lichenicola TaxID=2051959 RepID=A0A7W8N2W0_9BACT|nr:hypothetical protein [Edaphobacter lichenicola]MBB5342813.1 hypothetical protein [Edaphobacter lichenicola]
MQTPTYADIHNRYTELTTRTARQNNNADGFLETHHVLDIARSLFLSSLLWMALAIIVYTVYSMVAGAH